MTLDATQMPLPKDEADALRHCAAILSKQHSPHERKVMAVNVAQRIKGANNSQLCFRFKQVATLFYPNSPEQAAAFLTQMEEASRCDELVTQIPATEKGLFIDDLIVWEGCPPVPFDSPLRYWFPVAMHERSQEHKQEKTVHAMDEENVPGRVPGTLIGRLVVRVAWQIECGTKRRASAKEVMTRLQEMADAGEEPGVLKKSDKVHRAVIWVTAKGDDKDFTMDACREALRLWNKSRQTPE